MYYVWYSMSWGNTFVECTVAGSNCHVCSCTAVVLPVVQPRCGEAFLDISTYLAIGGFIECVCYHCCQPCILHQLPSPAHCGALLHVGATHCRWRSSTHTRAQDPTSQPTSTGSRSPTGPTTARSTAGASSFAVQATQVDCSFSLPLPRHAETVRHHSKSPESVGLHRSQCALACAGSGTSGTKTIVAY